MSRLARRQSAAVQAPSVQTYKCQQCNMSFLFPSLVRRHMLTNTGKWPYTCDICGEEFTHLCNLERHVGTHKGEHSYPCATCGNHFSTKYNLERHQRTKHAAHVHDHHPGNQNMRSSPVTCVCVCVCRDDWTQYDVGVWPTSSTLHKCYYVSGPID